MSEDDVTITRNKKLLESIREDTKDVSKQPGSGVGDRHAEGGDNINRQNERGATRGDRGTERGTTGATKTNGTAEGLHQGIRPSDRTSEHTYQGTADGNRRPQERINFQLRNPFHWKEADSRLFTEKEARDELERMTEIYFRGSGILDDILEIIVKDHEPVQIWQLEEEEAATLAEIHLHRATQDKRAAASARRLLALYDRLYFWLLVTPRAKLTAAHIKEHGGLSFR